MYLQNKFLTSTTQNLGLYGVFSILASWTSLYVFANHTPHYIVFGIGYWLVLLGLGSLLFWRSPAALTRLLSTKVFWVIGLSILSAIALVRYQKQLRAVHPNVGSFALIEPAKQLMNAHDPYLVHLDREAPVSPGPGWIILLAPLTLTGGVALITPLCIAGCCYLLQKKNIFAANIFVCLLLIQPVLVSVICEGHDIFSIPIAFAFLCLLGERIAHKSGAIAILALLAGFFATSRIPMFVLLMILGLGLYRLKPRSGAIFMAISISVTFLLHMIFYLWTRHDKVFYQPLHLIHRAGQRGHGMEPVAFTAASVVAIWVIITMGNQARDWILAGGLFLIAAFAPQGVGELINDNFHYAKWEGSFYVSLGLSLLLGAVVLSKLGPAMNSNDQAQFSGTTHDLS